MKPCPFCGSTKIVIYSGKVYWAWCDHCGATGPHVEGRPSTQSESPFENGNRMAKEGWDKRV